MAKSRSKEPVPIKHPPAGELADHWARVVKLALELPTVEESRSYGTPSLKAQGKLVARLRSEAEGGLALRCDFEDRDVLLQADGDAFYLTDHYRDYPMILVDLAQVKWDLMPDLLEQDCRPVSPKRGVAALDEEHGI